MTTYIITTLTRHGADEFGTPRYSEYTYTDISRFLFLSAQKLFRDQGARMEFNALSLEDDPIGQGFVEGKHDPMVAVSVSDAFSHVNCVVERFED